MSVTRTLCTEATCPSKVPHNAGRYNFTPGNDSFLTNKLPEDVRAARERILNTDYMKECFEEWEFFMKFAVAHQSHRPGLMPSDITWLGGWGSPEMVKIRESAQAPPSILSTVQKVVTHAKESVPGANKSSLPTTGRRIGVGRGVDMTKKANFLLGPLVNSDGVVVAKRAKSSDGSDTS